MKKRMVEQYAEQLKNAQFMGGTELRDKIMENDFLGATKLQGGYKFTLAAENGNVYELNTVTGMLQLIARDHFAGGKAAPDPDENIALSAGLLHAIHAAVAKDFALPAVRLYKLQEVADILHVTRQTIYNYVTAGRLHATKFGKEYRVTEDDLRALLTNGHN